MRSIQPCPVPGGTLLDGYRRRGAYADCYLTALAAPVSLADYVAAFYTTPLFRVERLILRLAIARPSTDAQARGVADGSAADFAAWRVEARAANELLMCDVYGRTRSWFMVQAAPAGGPAHTRLYFGSAVVPKQGRGARPATSKSPSGALLGFHRLYSVLLLRSARSRLESRLRTTRTP